MQKNKNALLVVLILWLWLRTSAPVAFAASLMIPPLPSSFYGTVKVNNENVPLGTTISAWINGIECGETQSQMFNGESVYAIDVAGDDLSTPGIIEGGQEGDTIVFQVGALIADQTAAWHSGTNVELNLFQILLLENNIFLPLILN